MSAFILNSRDNWVSIITMDWAVELVSPVWSRSMVLKFSIIPRWVLGSNKLPLHWLTGSLSPRTALTRDGVYLVLKLRCENLISMPPYNCMVQCLLLLTLTFLSIFWCIEWNYKAIEIPYIIVKLGMVFQC